MRKTALMLATLPFMAGFALPAFSQQAPSGADALHLRLSQQENQIRQLTGQLEQREYQLRQLQESYDAFVENTNARLRGLEGGAQPAAPAPTNNTPTQNDTPPQPTAPSAPAPTSDLDAPYNPNGSSGNLGQMDVAPSEPSDTVTSGRPQTQNPAAAYDQAFGYLQDKNYTDAENAFQDFLKNHASHALAGNAQYWLGETYYAQTQYTAAARTFAKAFQDYPNGQKAPDALFKLALTLEKMNKNQDACLTIAELKKRFPTGPASVLRRADEESARMQCQP